MAKETQQKVMQLQLLQQNLQNLAMQKQQFQMQLNEIESAHTEMKDAKHAYRIIGSIMVQSSKDDIEKDLKEKKETIELRIKSIETQEQRLREKAEEYQKQLMKEVKEEK